MATWRAKPKLMTRSSRRNRPNIKAFSPIEGPTWNRRKFSFDNYGFHRVRVAYGLILDHIMKNWDFNKVLKTDCDNEAHKGPVIVNKFSPDQIDCVEFNPESVAIAKNKFPDYNFTEGTIEALPFEDNSYDLILDFSTIDHVENYPKVLDEYKRVSKSEGDISIVAWMSRTTRSEMGMHYSEYNKQWFFGWEEFEQELENRFEVKEVVDLAYIGEGHNRGGGKLPLPRSLRWFHCKNA